MLRLDLHKADLHAKGGFREHWLIDVEARRLLVHRLRGEPEVVSADATTWATLIPGLKLRFADLPRIG
jgi:hypothetical protein